ncbi:MAG: hypothetical protein GQ574_02485 [Crocinitomix sp.]|nr:hypothetical protein [Crocinitomix sp.]
MELPKNHLSKAMKVLLLFIIFLSIGQTSFSQNHPDIRTRDVIYMKDGRVLKGEIIDFQESNGAINFVDDKGTKYSIAKEEYEYFIEDQRINVRYSDSLVLNSRKIDDFEFSFGLSTIVFEMKGVSDEEYGNNKISSPWYIPYNIRLAGGRYFGRQHYLGLRVDYALAGLDNYLSPALKYKFQFDGYRGNIGWYITIEGKYERVVNDFQSIDKFTKQDGKIEYDWKFRQQAFHNLGFVLGPGMAFILGNERSASIELSFFKNYVLSNSFINNSPNGILVNRWNVIGLGLAVSYNI